MDEAEELVDEDTFDKIDLSVRNKAQENRIILILTQQQKNTLFIKGGIKQRCTSWQ